MCRREGRKHRVFSSNARAVDLPAVCPDFIAELTEQNRKGPPEEPSILNIPVIPHRNNAPSPFTRPPGSLSKKSKQPASFRPMEKGLRFPEASRHTVHSHGGHGVSQLLVDDDDGV